jgi:hypothetical protein
MGVSDVLQMAGQYGSTGLLVAYLIWSEQRRDKQRASARAAELAERAAERAERVEIEKADIASREKLAISLTALSMVIQGRPHV